MLVPARWYALWMKLGPLPVLRLDSVRLAGDVEGPFLLRSVASSAIDEDSSLAVAATTIQVEFAVSSRLMDPDLGPAKDLDRGALTFHSAKWLPT